MVIPAGFGQVSFFFTGAGVPTGAAVTVGFENTNSASAADAAAAMRTNFGLTIMLQVSATVLLGTTRVKLGPDDTGPIGDATGSTAGSLVGSACPPAVAMLVRKFTGLGGRQGRGRMFIPGCLEANVNESGQLTGAFRTALQTEVDDFATECASDALPLRLLHSEPTIPPTTITDLVVDLLIATQRRRLRR